MSDANTIGPAIRPSGPISFRSSVGPYEIASPAMLSMTPSSQHFGVTDLMSLILNAGSGAASLPGA
jgi:hypothetical protein